MTGLPLGQEQRSSLSLSPRQKEPKPERRNYLLWGVLLNTMVWALAFAYLKFAPRTYTSQWGVVVVGTTPGLDVTLPERGRTAPNPYSERPWIFQDPRSAYSYMANHPSILEAAAKRLNLSVKRFGKPIINVDKESAVIGFTIQGKTPKEAQEKARVLYQVINAQVNRLRSSQVRSDLKETQDTLNLASDRLDQAKSRLSQYQGRSLLQSEDQIRQLSTNLEDLYRQRAELASQNQGLQNRLGQLLKDAGISSGEAKESYALQADQGYVQQFAEYGKAATAYNSAASQLGPEHPQVLERKAAAEGAAAALQQRASFLLGRSVSLQELAKIGPVAIDPGITATRESLFPDMITTRAKQQETAATLQELNRQIVGLKQRLQVLSQEAIVTDSIKRDIQISEAIFTNSLAKVDGQGDIDSIYPPMRLVAEPSLPSKATTPNSQIGLIGGLAGSFLVTTGLLLSWYEKRRPKAETVLFDGQS